MTYAAFTRHLTRPYSKVVYADKAEKSWKKGEKKVKKLKKRLKKLKKKLKKKAEKAEKKKLQQNNAHSCH